MSPNRRLPERHNPLLLEDVPPHSELVSRRRLGQTQLTARMVAAVAGGEVDKSTLGAFDYAHLRAPLPKGIVSGIFKSSPPSYFLMRRSQDGFVSATGMFKATFPYATQEEENAERLYIKSLPTTSPDETAGNVWIPPEQALTLAEEYNILPWIQALLDPADIAATAGADSGPPKKITAPPKFFSGQPTLVPPAPTSTRASRSRRSASPAKSTTSKRPIASPRKRRVASSQSSIATDSLPPSTGDSVSPTLVNGELSFQSQLSAVSKIAKIAKVEETTEADLKIESIEREPAVVLQPVEEEPKIKVHVDQDVKVDAEGDEVQHTKVEVEVPLLNGELPSADDAAKMVAEAKAMVEAAVKANNEVVGSASGSGKGKRKADDIAQDEEGEEKDESAVESPKAKKVKTEAELRKEKIRKRAFFGLTATVAVGAFGALLPVIAPYVTNAL
ncbi:DNA-binding domain of Mlu1-box binding protein MBP1 [Parathielavia appendiculata]|uniref:DNA-binding domain of Mlu1-box binding protein MBP1 n=1 Tax=Parathielavia appendiculata TaxID=2587402 RepID=A0AAN6U523_9PEZI|nr:DNA-binding domain of Mlu1-box binding protein MBP1 [Parathielavia appendiculata]